MLLEAQGLTKAFGSKLVLNDVSFEVGEKEIVSIMGPSGEGKSTIARVLCGTILPDAGNVVFQGENLISTDHHFNMAYRRAVQLIPQQPFASLDPRQPIGEAIAEPLLFHKIVGSRRQARERAYELLEKVLLDPVLFDRRPGELSGGQAQRVLIARSLTVSPKLLIADEATSMLDISSQAEIVKIFRCIVDNEGLSILFISHDRPLVESISNRTYHLSQGKMQEL